MKRINLLFCVVLSVLTFLACGKAEPGDNFKPGEDKPSEIIVRGVIDDGTVNPENGDAEVDYSKCPVLLTGSNIQWFNPRSKEVRFSQIKPYGFYNTYRKLIFEMNGEQLFTAATLTDVSSAVYNDLVLYYDLNGRYYLKDAYPDFALNHEQTRSNMEKRKDVWNKFLNQLRKENRLRQ